jgi:hypothetical protein
VHVACTNAGKLFYITTIISLFYFNLDANCKGDNVKAKNHHSKAMAASSSASSVDKQKATKVKGEETDPTGAGHLRKKAKTLSDGDLLSCADAAELIGEVAMELEGIQGALNHTWDALVIFTAHPMGNTKSLPDSVAMVVTDAFRKN